MYRLSFDQISCSREAICVLPASDGMCGFFAGFPLTTQPPGCYMSEDLESGAQSLYLNPVLCRLDAAACSWMTSRCVFACGREEKCVGKLKKEEDKWKIMRKVEDDAL